MSIFLSELNLFSLNWRSMKALIGGVPGSALGAVPLIWEECLSGNGEDK